jgi:hypothetical protein
MNHSTLDRDVAEAIYKLLGWLDVAKHYGKHRGGYKAHSTDPMSHSCRRNGCIPLPDFSETIRLIPRIAEKLEWSENGLWGTADDLARGYMLAPSPDQGMKEVSNYLREMLVWNPAPYKLSEREIKLRELAKDYHETCEAYDQAFCTGRTDKGVAMPVNAEEMGKINLHAHLVFARVRDEGKRCQLSTDEVMKAIQDYHS